MADEQIYCGICHVIRQIITTEGGFAGLYRGYAATALSMIPAVGKSRWWSQKTSNQCVAPFLKYYYSQLTSCKATIHKVNTRWSLMEGGGLPKVRL